MKAGNPESQWSKGDIVELIALLCSVPAIFVALITLGIWLMRRSRRLLSRLRFISYQKVHRYGLNNDNERA